MSWRCRLLRLVACSMCVFVVATTDIGAQQPDQRSDAVAIELALIRRIIAEQDRRLAELEQAIKALQEVSTRGRPDANIRRSRPSVSRQAFAPWHVTGNWARIKVGMSESQVTSILGPPTSIEQVASLRTLFYRGEVPGSGLVSGNVKLGEDRVYLVNKPIF